MQFDLERREVIALLGGLVLATRAQQAARIRRIGVLSAFAESDPEAQGNVTAFRQALERLGWTDGGNVRIDYRWGSADAERIRAYAIELVGLKPDVILAVSALVLQPLRHNQVRACHQSQDRKGPRPRSATYAARPRRRGDRVSARLLVGPE
jgi:ABC-type uncharacterized transport system substrate-binding protein